MAEATAPETRTDPAAWWDFESETPPESWRPAGTPILNGLMNYVPTGTDQRPWVPGHELWIKGQGGIVSKDRRQYTILGHGEYANHIGGCRKLVANAQRITAGGELHTQIQQADDVGDSVGDIPWGRDSLTVSGDASMTFGSRTLMMSGIVNRTWHGGVMRLASMEGIICGGAFLRLIASPSATMSGLNTGDVYGGCARVAAVRSYLAVLQYRAAQSAAWAMGVYTRNATYVIEPVVGSPSDQIPAKGLAKKLARLGQAMRVARMLCPVLDILVGVVTLVPLGIFALFNLIRGVVKKRVPIPPSGPPRTRNRTVGVMSECFSTITIN